MISFRTMITVAALLGAIAGRAGAQVGDTAGATPTPVPGNVSPASPGGDSTAGASGADAPDSAGGGAAGDSLTRPVGPVAPGDSTARPGDSTGTRPPTDSSPGAASAPNPAAVAIPAPVDSVLASACAGASAGSIAPGLLTVVFKPDATEREREAAAREVGGLLAGTDASGETYVKLGTEADPLSIVADRLIRQPPVMQVSVAGCPRVGNR
jgi:hypothetical protein